MNLVKKSGFRSKFADFLLLSGFILTIIALLIQFACLTIGYKTIPFNAKNPLDLWTPDNIWVPIWAALSTFTIQSNLLVLIFFCCVLTNRFYEKRAQFVAGRLMLAITTYITITIIVFFALLFKPILTNLDTSNPLNVLSFGNTFLLHLLIPLIMILYFMVTAGNYYWSYGKQAYLWTPLLSLYMFTYLGYALLKGNYVGQLDKSKNEITYSFPYPFLNFHHNLTFFLIVIFAIIGLYILLIALFTFYNNMMYKKRNKTQVLLKDLPK